MAGFDVGSQFDRLESQLSAAGLTQAAEWITRHTKVKGEPFSFADHEYQIRVAQEQAQIMNVRKCSQIGLSELSVRLALAYGMLVPGFTTIYTLPTLLFARNFSTTRIDTVIAGSDTLSAATNTGVNNAEVKQFGDSFIFVKGTSGTSQAISIPADCIVSDEYDFSDIDTVTNYQSRLTHSKHKLKRNFSTPTVEGYGISAEFAESQQWWMQAKCSCCGHWFLPDYYQHVRIPDCTLDLRQITKRNIHTIKHAEAYVECPACKGKPDLSFGNREWVCANASENREAVGIQIQPFDAPAIITPGDLIKASTQYARRSDFDNFNLGLPSADAESALTRKEVEDLFLSRPNWGSPVHFMGVDLGHVCHIMIGFPTPDGELRVVHAEAVDYRMLEKRYNELVLQYRVVMTVMDQYPYQETVYRMQQGRWGRNLWAAQFVEKRGTQSFEMKHIRANPEEGQVEVREVVISRNRALDALLEQIRTPNGVLFADCAEKENVVDQLIDMKRIKDITSARKGLEYEQFTWVKSKAAHDHFHHALLYLHIAAQLRGATLLSGGGAPLRPILGKIKGGKV